MTKISALLVSCLLTVSGLAAAQGTSGGVTESTDPAKAAAVEQKAQQMQQRSSAEPTIAAPQPEKPMRKHRMHKQRHMKHGAKVDAEAKDAPTQ
ncbi:hypothetical protein ACFOFO_06785 [Undibacterium arcticum]|uniref:Uncharacterized protein n=2 Tax=Undibacterium arcticum TaxID=1762892 RepID=A0ABV7F0Y4_9BURK